jgi:hypothetical protein
MNRRTITLLLVSSLLVFAATTVAAQQTFDMDLAVFEEATDTIDAGEKFYIRVSNMIDTRYRVRVERKLATIAPLTDELAPAAGAGDDCANLVANFETDRAEATTEAAIKRAVETWRSAGSGCTPEQQKALEDYIERTTTKTLGPYVLGQGESLVATVSRGTGDGEEKWVQTVATPAPGEWRMLYGFNFVPNRDRTYFLESDGNGKFNIERERNDNELNFVPTIFATWHSRRALLSGSGFAMSGGLGFDSADPVVFAGPSWIYRENFALNVGLVMAKQKRLNRQLDEDTPVEQNLSDEQLHSTGYHPNLYVGVSLRFGKNPFKKTPAETEGEGEGEGDDGEQ